MLIYFLLFLEKDATSNFLFPNFNKVRFLTSKKARNI